MISKFIILPHQLFPRDAFPNAEKYVFVKHKKYLTKKYGQVKYDFTKKCMDEWIRAWNKTDKIAIVNDMPKTGHMFDPIDFVPPGDIIVHDTPAFVLTIKEAYSYDAVNKMTKIYNDVQRKIYPKKKLQKSRDKENREPFPKDANSDAIRITESNNVSPAGICTRRAALARLRTFMKDIALFGKYQDAIMPANNLQGYHSALSAALNIGLIIPHDIIDEFNKHVSGKWTAAQEGYIRQIIGWREFCRVVYVRDYLRDKNKNIYEPDSKDGGATDMTGGADVRTYSGTYAGKRKMTKIWYPPAPRGTTADAAPKITDADIAGSKLPPPVYVAAVKLLHHGYVAHIERLMVVAMFMQLCEIRPCDMFKWFMHSIDSYDWVMYPNIFGMATHADGGRMMTKPYLASDNYVSRMSSARWDKCENAIPVPWTKLWHALYYRYILQHKKALCETPHARGVTNWNAKSQKEQAELKSITKKHIRKFSRS